MGFFSGATDRQLARIERKLDLIIEHLGIEVTSGLSPEVEAAIQRGNKIEAIKAYREETNVGLKEAKEYIESYM